MDKKKLRGFAAMKDKARIKEIASLGGRRAHELGTAHQWTPEEAKVAGRKGGLKNSIAFQDETTG